MNSLRRKYVVENKGYDKYVLVFFPHSLEECYNNNLKRDIDLQVPYEAFKMLWDKFEPLDDEVMKLFDEIIEVKFTSSEKHIYNTKMIKQHK